MGIQSKHCFFCEANSRKPRERCGMSDIIDHQIENLKSVEPHNYLFESPASEPSEELLKLLPQKSSLEYLVDFGLHFVALFQFVCLICLFWLKDPAESKKEETESEKKQK